MFIQACLLLAFGFREQACAFLFTCTGVDPGLDLQVCIGT